MKPRRLAAYVRRPSLLVHRARRFLFDLRNPGAPWLAPKVIAYLERELRSDMRGLEWGSGRSTAWLGRRLGSLTSVEHNPAWFDRVNTTLRDARLTNVDLRLVSLDHDGAEPPPEQITVVPAYVAVADGFGDESLDFVLVDGSYRSLCVLAARPKLTPGGLLVVDDANWLPGLGAELLSGWPLVCGSSGISNTLVWRKPSPIA